MRTTMFPAITFVDVIILRSAEYLAGAITSE